MTLHEVVVARPVERDVVKYGARRCVALVVCRDAQGTHVKFIDAADTIIIPNDGDGKYEDVMHGWAYQGAGTPDAADK